MSHTMKASVARTARLTANMTVEATKSSTTWYRGKPTRATRWPGASDHGGRIGLGN